MADVSYAMDSISQTPAFAVVAHQPLQSPDSSAREVFSPDSTAPMRGYLYESLTLTESNSQVLPKNRGVAG
jgi:hypothetical protein